MFHKEYRSFTDSKWICAPDELLKGFNRPQAEEFPTAKYIWSRRYTRAYFRRTFTPEKELSRAFIRFICDNTADVFLNGTRVACELRDTGITDVTSLMISGKNLLTVRAYQTATHDSFTSAITGGIHLEYTDGTSEDIVTDGDFENFRFIDFWQNEEPEGWQTDPDLNFEVNNQLIVTDLHPIAVKRSFFMRKEFTVTREIRRATLCATALGCYEPHINGSAVDEVYFLPSASEAEKEYQQFDVTSRIVTGKNALSAVLGNGWYNCEAWGCLLARKPALLMELTLEYTDGGVEVIGTDESWLMGPSPLTDNDLQFGERYDARLEIEGWNTSEGPRERLHTAAVIEEAPYGKLLRQDYPYIRAANRLPTRFIRQLPDGSYLYDCGINIAGAVELTLRNTVSGQRVIISVTERLDADGNPEIGAYTAPYFPADSAPDGKAPCLLRNYNVYYAKGAEEERYSPRFCYTGFRYVYIKGTEYAPDPTDIVVREMHSDLTVTGRFSSETPYLNDLWRAVRQTWFNNCYNGPTDCPTREKNFWTGDMMIFSSLACYMTDCSDFLAHWTDHGRKMTGPYGWEDEEYMLPWTLYRFYGDTEILRERYTGICRLLEWRMETAQGGPLPKEPFSCYNDWLSPTGENLSTEVFSHCWYLHMLDIVSKIAGVLGDTSRETELASLFVKGKDAFNKLHYDPVLGEYREHIQSSAILPLAFGLVPAGEKQRVAESLHNRLEENCFRLTTGFQASRYILDVLTENGYGEDAVKLLSQREFPSWRYMLDSGATNICESWLAMNDPDKSISMCHFSLGAAFSYFFEYLGGIRTVECAPGFSSVVLEPYCPEELVGCTVRYMTPHGEIASSWHFEGDRLVWNRSVPEGVKAEIREPHIIKKR